MADNKLDRDLVLLLTKFNIGLTTDLRDEYLKSIINSAVGELKKSGIDPEGQSEDYFAEYTMYVADYSAWLYRNRGGEQELPRHLRFRRHNLILGRNDV